jgi:hypothetical protein
LVWNDNEDENSNAYSSLCLFSDLGVHKECEGVFGRRGIMYFCSEREKDASNILLKVLNEGVHV